MTVLDRVAKTKGALAFEKVQVPHRASRFFFFFLPHRSRLMTAGLTTKKEEEKKKKGTSLPWEGDGKKVRHPPNKSLSTSGPFFPLAR